jgi:hypothetical protein
MRDELSAARGIARAVAIGAAIWALIIFGICEYARADEPQQSARQFVMIGPLTDGRRVWCPGREEKGSIIVSEADVALCFADTTDVQAPVICPVPAPESQPFQLCPSGAVKGRKH